MKTATQTLKALPVGVLGVLSGGTGSLFGGICLVDELMRAAEHLLRLPVVLFSSLECRLSASLHTGQQFLEILQAEVGRVMDEARA